MTSINRLDRAISTLRQQLAERSATNKSTSHQDARELTQTDRLARSKQLQERIKKGLTMLDLTQAADQERGTTIFLETVLANEFGAGLLADPAFHNLMADVRAAMLADKNTHRDLVNMLVELKNASSASK